jgi:lysophospholipase L1-like esterase
MSRAPVTAATCLLLASCASSPYPPPGAESAGATPGPTTGSPWVGTWACGPQRTETGNLPPPPGLANRTLRQIVYTSIGGRQLRVRLSNAFGDGPVTLNAVHVAISTGDSAIDASTDRELAFAGSPSLTIPAGRTVWSDALTFPLAAQTTVAITIRFGAVPAGITGHPGSRTTSYLTTADGVSAPSLAGAATVTVNHWYYITGIDVVPDAAPSAAIVTLGDSLTDGRGSTTNGNDRWPDDLSRRLRATAATARVAVLNQGIGGNAVVSGGLGPTAMERFPRDVLEQSGVRWLIVFEGVNDIGAATGSGKMAATSLINAFGGFIDAAHARKIRVYGVPITPFAGSFYDSPDHQTARRMVNDWIRTSGRFDAVIDLDAAVRDPAQEPMKAPTNAPTNDAHLLAAYDVGDRLHLNPAGYQKMADAIDLALFEDR